MSQSIADPLIGKTIAQYYIVARLGGGGMGIVYRAEDTKLGRPVALKFLPPQWSHDDTAKQRFIREAQAASATDHRNICTIHDIGSSVDGQLFIVMAFYGGRTLKQQLEAGALTVDEAVEIAAQLAEGLAKAHAQGVIHRDIKPSNVMVTDDAVKIVDFGLAKFADARFKLTLEGSTIGTIAYMSPEQARGEEADARSDVWSVGVVLYEMLSGRLPFTGGYPEAIAHAIKNEPPPPLRERDGVSETLEQLVFRAIHKEPAVRFQSARDLARALRLLQGGTLPVDLRTEPLAEVDLTKARARLTARRPRWWSTHRAVGIAAAVVLMLAGTAVWVFSPIERIPIAVAPVVNQTGYAELDPYRLALTEELTAALQESPAVRVLSYERLLPIVRQFRTAGQDVSSREAMEAIASYSGAQVILVPTLLYENGAWRARVEFRDSQTTIGEAPYETPPVVSALMKDTVYSLMAPLVSAVHEHFSRTGPRRAYIAQMIREDRTRASRRSGSRWRTLDAAAAFEQGLDAYEQQEYSAALRSFVDAANRDPNSPLPLAWHSRVARIMRHDQEAASAAQGATRLLVAGTSPVSQLFVEAVSAESRRDLETAKARYQELASRFPDDPSWLFEFAAFHDRQGRPADAIAAYQRGLTLDDRAIRPHLELCRLYNPNELAEAKTHGQRALAAYRALHAQAGEAHALWCLADALRLGKSADVQQARQHADAARTIFEAMHFDYNLARAYNYVALVAVSQERLADAVNWWERSLVSAKKVGNLGLQPLAMMNLGVMQTRLGNRTRALDYYRESAREFESLGQEQRAAELQANAANILIENGGNPEQGLRDVQNALGVARKFGNRNFEVLAAQLTAAYYRYAGRHQDAEHELNRALAIVRERDLENVAQGSQASLTTDLARSRMAVGDYESARTLLLQAVGAPAGSARTHARIRLGQTYVHLGDFEGAQRELMEAQDDLQGGVDADLVSVLAGAMGELAYESGRLEDAGAQFRRAAAFWTDDLPDAASVEARAYIGLLESLGRSSSQGRAALISSLEQARKMGRLSLETLCRVFLARIDVEQRRFDEALRTLSEVPADAGTRTVGQELRAQVRYWRGRALAGLGKRIDAQTETRAARELIEELRASLPEPYRARFIARPDIQRIIG